MRNNVNSVWTIERIDMLVNLQKRRWSCSQIAAELGCGITRNAVIGKLHRMGITGGMAAMPEEDRIRRAVEANRSRVARQRERQRERRAAFVAPDPAPRRAFVPLVCADVEPRGISLIDLEPGDCRYPDGEGDSITFCGHPSLAGRSYCGPHARLTLSGDRSWSRAEMESNRRDRKAKFNQALLEAAE